MTYESKNSSSLLRSVQVGAFGSFATALASSRASRSRWCASLRRRASHRLCDSSKVSSMSESQVGMCAGVGKRQDQEVVFDFIDQHPVILNVAVSRPGIVADQGMILVLGRKRLTSCEHGDDCSQFRAVLAALKHQLQTLFETSCLQNFVFHEKRNSSSLFKSVQRGALGSLATSSASFSAAIIRACLLIFPSLKGISPTDRHFLRKQVMPVVMFMPISSKNSSASAFSSLSTRMVIADVIVSILSVRKNDDILLKTAYAVNGDKRRFGGQGVVREGVFDRINKIYRIEYA